METKDTKTSNLVDKGTVSNPDRQPSRTIPCLHCFDDRLAFTMTLVLQ